MLDPLANISRINETHILWPLIQGLPKQIFGFTEILASSSSLFIVEFSREMNEINQIGPGMTGKIHASLQTLCHRDRLLLTRMAMSYVWPLAFGKAIQ